MAFLKEYVLSITSVCVIGLVLNCFLPEGNIKKYASFGISVILSIALIQPITQLLKNDFSVDCSYDEYVMDYTEAVKSTVNSVKGFENADVIVQQENNKIKSITIKSNNKRILEDTVEEINKNFLKKMIKTIYDVDENNILFTE